LPEPGFNRQDAKHAKNFENYNRTAKIAKIAKTKQYLYGGQGRPIGPTPIGPFDQIAKAEVLIVMFSWRAWRLGGSVLIGVLAVQSFLASSAALPM
jgi:hypothetical protein